MKLKTSTPSQAIKFGSFAAWVLVIVSSVKGEGAEYLLPSYMCHGGVSILNSSSEIKLKNKGKTKYENTNSDNHQIKLSIIVFNWTDPKSDCILFSDIPLDDPCIGT